MKVLFISKNGDGLGLASRLSQQGHSVDLFIQSPAFRHAGEGIVNRVGAWRPSIMRADMVVCDGPGFSQYSDVFKQRGIPALGCNMVADVLHSDYARADEMMRKAGLSTAPVADGIAVSVEGWFNGRAFLQPFLYIFDETRMLDGDRGPFVGSMGALVLAERSTRLSDATLGLLLPILSRSGYRGPVRVDCLVGRETMSVITVRMSLSFDAADAMAEGLQAPLGDLLFETATGISQQLPVKVGERMIAVRVTLPPWPHDGAPAATSLAINDQNVKHISLVDVLKNGEYKCAGSNGLVMKVCAHGHETHIARGRAYRTIRNLNLPDAQYRTDIGARADVAIGELRKMGWLK